MENKAASRKAASPASGTLRLTQHRLPALESGSYRLTFSQAVSISGSKQASATFGDTLHFAVSGDRFVLPQSGIDSMFPAPGAQGEFYNVLPHVTLTTRSLPWQRSVVANLPAASGNAVQDVPSWLALLVFDDSEAPPVVKPGTLAALVSPENGVLSYPGLTLEYGETLQDPCNVVDLDGGVFARIAPSIDDLRWLAHVRTVSAANKPGTASQDQHRDYAVVVANRLPRMGGKTSVFLVSLEGMADFLPGSGQGGQPKQSAALLRLACLASWRFDCPLVDQTFAGVLESLRSVSVLAPACASASEPGSDSERAVRDAMAMGYVGLDHKLRDGGRTVSWYRGPLIPYPAAAWLRAQLPLRSADAALQYDPDTGLLDASYACAWQLGRMLALQSKDFSGALLAWKHAIQRQNLDNAERTFLLQRIAPDALPTGAPGASLDALAMELVRQAIPALNQPVTGDASVPAPTYKRQRRPGPAHVLTSSEHVRAALDQVGMPEPIAGWLDRLRKLHGVPYPYLLPREELLPPESMRSFCLDMNWTDALIDGAFSLGASRDGDLAVRCAIHHAGLLRTGGAAPATVYGFLLRSIAVRQWPGLEATPYQEGVAVPLLRFERIGPETVLCLIDGQFDQVQLHEPPEGVHFGFDVPDSDSGAPSPSTFYKFLRSPSDGSPITAPNVPISSLLRGDGFTLDIDGLAQAIADALPVSPATRFTAAEFALEMIEGVDMVRFVVTARGQPLPKAST